jgi:hypothetical protein
MWERLKKAMFLCEFVEAGNREWNGIEAAALQLLGLVVEEGRRMRWAVIFSSWLVPTIVAWGSPINHVHSTIFLLVY